MSDDSPVFIDFEARSRCDLKTRGGRIYCAHPTTDPLCAVLYYPDGVEVWAPWDPPPPRIKVGVAHNAMGFDRFAAERFGWQVDRWIDSSQLARKSGLPGALDALGKRWLGRDKDKEGNRVTLAMSQPSRAKATKGQLPELTPKKFRRIVKYCADDVEIMVEGWPRLKRVLDVDVDVAEVDTAINDRGITVDTDLVKALLRQFERQTERALETAARELGRGWSPERCRAVAGSPAQLVAEAGLENAQADTLRKAAAEGDNHPLIAARLAMASVVPGKLRAALLRTEPDGRMRDALHYYGGHTGRWSSKGMQIHNLPRVGFEGDAHKIGWLVEDYVEALCDGALTGEDLTKKQVSGLLRATLTAAPGCLLGVYDYSGIEARANAWAAGDEEALNVFRAKDAGTGPDPYRVMAMYIFACSLDQVTGGRRQIGKNAELGCFAADTLVVTHRGTIPIVDVLPTDRVWDGVEWVRHHGLVDRGERSTVELAGVQATPDHLVWCGEWKPWVSLVRDESVLSRALAAASAPLQSPGFRWENVVGFKPSWSDATVASRGSTPLTQTTCFEVGRPDATIAQRRSPGQHVSGGFDTRMYCRTTLIGSGYSTESRRVFSVAITRSVGGSPAMGVGVSESRRIGGSIERSSFNTSCRSPDGMTPSLNSIGSTTIVDTYLATYASLTEGRTCPTEELSRVCRNESTNSRRVYDLAYAGARNRFTILTKHGPLLVHNCGYGMGWRKFGQMAADQGTDLAAEGVSPQDVVNAWRKKKWKIVRMWRDCEKAFELAAYGRTIAAGAWVYKPGPDGSVICELPSGRPIIYPEVNISRGDRYGNSITYMGTRFREHLYGGKLVENAIQGLCRDLLSNAMVRCEDDGLSPVLHVHDELVCEFRRDEADDGFRELHHIMSTPPEWADGLPIVLEGFLERRYRK